MQSPCKPDEEERENDRHAEQPAAGDHVAGEEQDDRQRQRGRREREHRSRWCHPEEARRGRAHLDRDGAGFVRRQLLHRRLARAGADTRAALRAEAARFGRREPQFAQLAVGTEFSRARLPWLERPEELGRAATQRPDERAVVVVGDLARAVVELELLQRRERPVALLLEGDPFLSRVPAPPAGRARAPARAGRAAPRAARRPRRAGRRGRARFIRPSWRARTSTGTSSRACPASRRRRRARAAVDDDVAARS